MDTSRNYQVNRPALAASALAAYAWLVRPQGSPDDWRNAFLFAILVLCVIGCGGSAVRGMFNRARRRRLMASARRASGTLGDARFASLSDLHAAGLTDPSSGPLLCKVGGIPIFGPRQTHLTLEGPPGSGKSTSMATMLVVHLAMSGFSVCVTDIKPELALIAGKELERRGFRVIYNNPAGLCDLPHTDQNPFHILIEEAADEALQGRLFTTAEGFAFELTPEPDSDAKNKYFRDQERGLFVVIAVALAVLDPQACVPSVLWSHVTDPILCEALLKDAAASDALYGDLASQARHFLKLKETNAEHFEGARAGLAQALSPFRASSDLGFLGLDHAFDAADLRDESKPPVILFDIVPTDALETYGKAVALLQYARLQTLKRVKGRRVVFCLDEATNLPLRNVAKDITLLRSRGIVIALLYQSISELKRVFGEKVARTITTNSIEQFLQVSDLETAEMLSKRIGDHTVKTNSLSVSHRDGSTSTSTGEHAKRLVPPDEILAMGHHETLVFVPGLRPIRGQKVPYYHIDPVKFWPGADAHERHAVSNHTEIAFEYSSDAHRPTRPRIKGHARRLRKALERERRSNRAPRAPVFDLHSFLWVPIVASVWGALAGFGSPHVLFEYSVEPDVHGVSTCTYLGATGARRTHVSGRCPALHLFRERAEAS
ncbi:MAG: type IV secretory system conjugative DNA transfer family protein [Pseudomonadota bacterium]